MKRALQLRTRLAIAGALLITTTVLTGVWSVTAFRRVSRVVGETVRANEQLTDATTKLVGAIEREDDAVLLAFSDIEAGEAELKRQRDVAEAAIAKVVRHEPANELQAAVDAYEQASEALLRTGDREHYNAVVNPLLRRAVDETNAIRDRHFASSQSVAEWAGEQATRSMQIVATISVVAFLLLVLIVVHLARVVMVPIGEMTRAVQAIRRGDFSQRVSTRRDDELGRLGGGLNRMADELEEFRRTNIGEVIHAKETLEATLEALPDAVLVIDEARAVSAANPRAADALASERGRALVDEALAAPPNTTVDLAKAVAIPLGGRARRLLPRLVPIGGKRGAVLVLSDVTELARVDEMRLELVAVASHELRTPLTTLKMTLAMLQEHAAGRDSRDRELVSTAMLGVEQLGVLVDEFLDLTRIEAGELRLQWTTVPLRALLEQAAKAAAPLCEQAEVALKMVHCDLESIPGDSARLAMVVSNLLSNALKHTPSGGQIEMTTVANGTVQIIVDDSGPGVPPELRERVFERFFRADTTTSGVGIGLYIARQVIEAHGGTIRCEASPLGGARFVVELKPTK